MTDDDLASIDFPAGLRELDLSDTAITDRGVEELSRIENLEFVNLKNTQVTDACFEVLKQFPNLRSANVLADNVDIQNYKRFLRHMAEKQGGQTRLEGRNVGQSDEPMVITPRRSY